tara:strand:+ start:76 stop:912 length:837 start_codon:yes stop_codon:yes gene_type:complete
MTLASLRGDLARKEALARVGVVEHKLLEARKKRARCGIAHALAKRKALAPETIKAKWANSAKWADSQERTVRVELMMAHFWTEATEAEAEWMFLEAWYPKLQELLNVPVTTFEVSETRPTFLRRESFESSITKPWRNEVYPVVHEQRDALLAGVGRALQEQPTIPLMAGSSTERFFKAVEWFVVARSVRLVIVGVDGAQAHIYENEPQTAAEEAKRYEYICAFWDLLYLHRTMERDCDLDLCPVTFDDRVPFPFDGEDSHLYFASDLLTDASRRLVGL